MNNMNGIISESQRIFNQELNLKDTKAGANEAVSFYSSAKARIAEENTKGDSLGSKQDSSKIVTGEELRRFFDRNYDMDHTSDEMQGRAQRQTTNSSTRDER